LCPAFFEADAGAAERTAYPRARQGVIFDVVATSADEVGAVAAASAAFPLQPDWRDITATSINERVQVGLALVRDRQDTRTATA
jgi:hypothetical protein